jgi:FkbM family methyltransferase
MIVDPKNLRNWKVTSGERSLSFATKRLRKHNPGATILDYQKENLEQALNLVKQHRLALDAGANFGIMSYHLSALFDHVISWEVDPDIRQCLCVNMQNFGCNNVQIEECGLAEKTGQVNIVRHAKSFANYIVPNSPSGTFAVRTVDSYQLQHVDFFKLDCEGYEGLILQGAQDTIQRCRPVILMEQKVLSKRYGHEVHHTQNMLSQWGYKVAQHLSKDVIMVPR